MEQIDTNNILIMIKIDYLEKTYYYIKYILLRGSFMFKVIGGVVWVLGTLGNLLVIVDSYDSEGSVSLLGVVISLVSVFLYGLLFWTIGVIFDELNKMRNLIFDLMYGMKKEIIDSLTKGSNKDQAQSTETHMVPIDNGVWACPSCGTVNTSSTITCKGCGQYR